MMKLLTASQARQLDVHTMENEPIASVDLMERAARAFVGRFEQEWPADAPVVVFAGPGNNGGDALAVSRLLAADGYEVEAYLFGGGRQLTADCRANRDRLRGCAGVRLVEVTSQFVPPLLGAHHVVVDGLFGTGLSRPLEGGFAAVVKYINASAARVVSIDVPSGLMTEDNAGNVRSHVVRADRTLTFQFPKLAFLFAENAECVGRWSVLDIGVVDPMDELSDTPYTLTGEADARGLLRPRPKFAHKGSMGHALLVAGQRGMAGAAVLSASACLRAGVGKLTVRTQEANRTILQMRVPEAVLDVEPSADWLCGDIQTGGYDAVAIGPGIGTEPDTAAALRHLMEISNCPLVLDADALNILAQHRDWLALLPAHSVLTPHRGELERLLGRRMDDHGLLQAARTMAAELQVLVVLKGAYSAVVSPDGRVRFNTTGNPGMATAGSGDVLTGIVAALLARGYAAADAACLGVCLHGLAGDCAARRTGEESLVASDIVAGLPEAFLRLENKQ